MSQVIAPAIREVLTQALPYTSPAMAEKITGMLLENKATQIVWDDCFNNGIDPYCMVVVNSIALKIPDLFEHYLILLKDSVSHNRYIHGSS